MKVDERYEHLYDHKNCHGDGRPDQAIAGNKEIKQEEPDGGARADNPGGLLDKVKSTKKRREEPPEACKDHPDHEDGERYVR